MYPRAKIGWSIKWSLKESYNYHNYRILFPPWAWMVLVVVVVPWGNANLATFKVPMDLYTSHTQWNIRRIMTRGHFSTSKNNRRSLFCGGHFSSLHRLTAAVVYRYQSFWHVSSCLLQNICKSRVVRTFSITAVVTGGCLHSVTRTTARFVGRSLQILASSCLLLNTCKPWIVGNGLHTLTRRWKFWNALGHPSSWKVCRRTSVDSSVKLFTAEHLKALNRGKRVAAALTRREKFWNALGDRD